MINLFRKVEDSGSIDATELSDLQLIVSTTSLFGSLDYVQQLSQDIVLGNAANSTYQGSALGNLSDGIFRRAIGKKLVDKWFLGSDHPAANSAYQTASAPAVPNGAFVHRYPSGWLGRLLYHGLAGGSGFKKSEYHLQHVHQ